MCMPFLPENTCTWETITNTKAALSYMIEPADSKASAIRAYLLGLQKFRPRGLPDWYRQRLGIPERVDV